MPRKRGDSYDVGFSFRLLLEGDSAAPRTVVTPRGGPRKTKNQHTFIHLIAFPINFREPARYIAIIGPSCPDPERARRGVAGRPRGRPGSSK